MKRNILISILFFSFISSLGRIGQAGLRLSLAGLLQGLPEAEISQEFKKPAPDPVRVKSWLEAASKQRAEFKTRVLESAPFIRGEIEQDKVLNSIVVFLQLSILHCRMDVNSCDEEIPLWFRFAGDLAYEEATLVGLRFTGLVRSLWLDELETLAKKDPSLLVGAQSWIWNLRSAWPVDRVILEEGRKILKSKDLVVVEKVMKDYQKNPYQSAEQMLKKVPGGKSPELSFIEKIWRPEDLDAMKTEMNRLNNLRIRAAMAKFEKTQKKKAIGFQDLMGAKLMSAIPVDYFTGRPLPFP